MVAISYNHGVILCEHHTKRLNGEAMAKLVKEHFPLAFALSINPKSKHILQDGCPVQNSKKARHAMEKLGTHLFSIPARSPDINPIENLFNQVRQQLHADALRKKNYQRNYRRVLYPSKDHIARLSFG